MALIEAVEWRKRHSKKNLEVIKTQVYLLQAGVRKRELSRNVKREATAVGTMKNSKVPGSLKSRRLEEMIQSNTFSTRI